MQPGRFNPVPNEGVSRQRFGQNANRIATIKITLDTALDKKEFKIGGTILWAVAASSKSASMEVSFDDAATQEGVRFKEGASIGGIRFDRIFITASAQAGEWIQLLYCVEEIENIRIENPGAIFTSIDVSKSTSADDQANVSVANNATSTIAALSTRRELIIKARAANTAALLVGPNAATGRGIELNPGESITLATTAAIKVFNDGTGAAQTYDAVWTKD